ncbi:MAG: TRAM domain-containing protein [Nitrospiria bacterium]
MKILRLLYFILSAVGGFYLFNYLKGNLGVDLVEEWWGIVAGGLLASILFGIEYSFKKTSAKVSVIGLSGLLFGLAATNFIYHITESFFAKESAFLALWHWGLLMSGGYLGLILGIKIGNEWLPLNFISKNEKEPLSSKILDTSVIIDGRIADLCETGFLEGAFIIPHFILNELQHIADSSDSMKRARGRRGLDVLNRIQKMAGLDIRIVDDDFPSIKEVDDKIVALAKRMNYKVITNDLNLNKVAEFQGVKVLNINELSNALKPVVLPGEVMKVFILKEGKESGQGIAYLDDGTMIVVDDARRWIGKNVEVIVTSVLQTTAGRMIFTRLKEDQEREELRVAR